MSSKYEIDMINGPLLGKILIFSIPLMLSGILQLLFNAADIVVVGRFAGDEALAAVGSTTSLINLMVNLFIGLSVGSNVVVAQHCGEKNDTEVSKTVHTAIAVGAISGTIISIVGVIFTRRILVMMDSPVNVIDLSVMYLKIYFLGMPALMIYNFGSAILRAIGDTKRPLYYLFMAGVINVIFNLLFVIKFNMSVAGVALATIISEYISAILVFRCLLKTEGACKLYISKLKIHKDKLLKIVRIGIPAGLQGILFSFSNVMIQSSVNSFGSVVVAGNTAAQNIEGFVYTSMNAFQQTSMNFTSQNYGAGNYRRIGKITGICAWLVVVVGLVLGMGVYFAGPTLLGIYTANPEAVNIGMLRLGWICRMYFVCGLMDLMVGTMRGMGYAVAPMVVSLLGACGFRIVWLYTIFAWYKTLPSLYVSYPVSWAITLLVHIICFVIFYKRLFKEGEEPRFNVD